MLQRNSRPDEKPRVSMVYELEMFRNPTKATDKVRSASCVREPTIDRHGFS